MKITDFSKPNAMEELVSRIAEDGWAVVDHFLPADSVKTLRKECMAAHREGGFHVAGIGRGGDFTVQEGIRSDEVMWLEPETASASQKAYFTQLDQIKQQMNEQFFMGLNEFEGHFAIYNEGALYKKHLDAFRGQRSRVLTVVFYLNDDWASDDGGELRLYLDPNGESEIRDIMPIAGRAVIFMAERFWHEVLPACRDRMSITGWFKVRST